MQVLSLGAGVQSTAMLLMAMHGEIEPKPDCAIFADTQAEPNGVYAHMHWLHHTVRGIPIYTVTHGNLEQAVLDSRRGNRFASVPFFVRNEEGKVGMLRRQCTREYKIQPINKKIRELCGLQPRQWMKQQVVVWIGITTDEITRVKPAREKWQTNRHPLIELEMSRKDCIAWLRKHDYPVPVKSSCYFCPFHDNNLWISMKKFNPVLFEKACLFDEEIRTGLAGVRFDTYVHRSLKPLREVDFPTAVSSNWDGECEGMCGV